MLTIARTSLILLAFLCIVDKAAATPADMINTYHEKLLAGVSEASNHSDQQRFDVLAPVMDASFDFEGMIKTASGTYWSKATPDQQVRLLAAFRRVSIATHADQFAGLRNGSFEIKNTRDGPRGLKLVDSVLKTGSEDVALSYVIRRKDSAWRIIDVLLAGGISELALRTSEYAGTLKKGGTPALAQALEQQATALLAD